MNLVGIGALIDGAWEQYRKRFPQLMKVSSWLFVIVLINIIAISVYPFDLTRETRTLTGLEVFGVVLFVVNNLILGYIVFRVWILNALIDMVDKHAGGTTIKMDRLSKRAWKLFLPQLVVHILMIIIYLIASAVPFVAYWIITSFLGPILPVGLTFLLLFLALLLFLIPLALLVYLLFAPFSVVLDKQRHIDAIKHSIRIVHGRFWAITWRLVVPKFLYFGALFVLQWLLLILLQTVILGIVQDADLVTLARIDSIITMVSYTVLVVLIYPIILITDYLLYRQLRG